MRSKLHQGAQNSPRSAIDVLSPSTPEQFNGEKYSSRVKSLAKEAAPINVAIQSKQELDNVLQDFRHLGFETNLSVSINVAIQSKQDLDNVLQDLSHLGFESNLSANFM
jgi:hypothetical protein